MIFGLSAARAATARNSTCRCRQSGNASPARSSTRTIRPTASPPTRRRRGCRSSTSGSRERLLLPLVPGLADLLGRRAIEHLYALHVRQPVRDALVTIDARMFPADERGRVHVDGARALACPVHEPVVVAVAALERIVGLESRPFVLRE